MHRDSSVGKGDRTQQIERGKNFIQALKIHQSNLKKHKLKHPKIHQNILKGNPQEQ
jgi:peptide methionine sulfoxide reductase MsrA